VVENDSTRPVPDDLLIVGRVGAPYGVKGWVKIHSFTQPAENILVYRPLYLATSRGSAPWAPVALDHFRVHGKGFVGQVAGCNDRDQALLLARRDLACSAAQFPALDDDDFYWQELEGMRVLARWQGVDYLLGDIAWMTSTGSNDVMVVRGTADSIDARERWIPWLTDQVVLQVQRQRRQVVVEWDPAF